MSNWGGTRPGAGRKPTGRKRINLFVTPEEETALRQQLELIRNIKEDKKMKRTTYKGYIIDTDNLGRQYVYNTASPYSEDSDKIIIGVGYKLADIKKAIDQSTEAGEWVGMDR
jgi:hypothetical protein